MHNLPNKSSQNQDKHFPAASFRTPHPDHCPHNPSRGHSHTSASSSSTCDSLTNKPVVHSFPVATENRQVNNTKSITLLPLSGSSPSPSVDSPPRGMLKDWLWTLLLFNLLSFGVHLYPGVCYAIIILRNRSEQVWAKLREIDGNEPQNSRTLVTFCAITGHPLPLGTLRRFIVN